eukprot:gene33598-43420_t
MSVPKVQLNISMDDMHDSAPNTAAGLRSIVMSAIAENVEDEKCVVAQYRTTTTQKEDFKAYLNSCDKDRVPIEWVIDIADESNGWFYGTAYHFDDTTQMLHVMVPDKVNPSFDGNVLLDHRTVHLIECVDGKTDALFNKIIRDSVIKVKWDVEWFEEVENGTTTQAWGGSEGQLGNWIFSAARYYIRIANQLLVEDKDSGQDSRGFVILTADMNLKLITCHKGKGVDDFNRLINEGTVQAAPEAIESAKVAVATSPIAGKGDFSSSSPGTDVGPTSLRKVVELSRGLREALGDNLAKMFHSFTLDGDLDEGLKMQEFFEKQGTKAEKNGDKGDKGDKADAAADESWYLVQKVEKSLDEQGKELQRLRNR